MRIKSFNNIEDYGQGVVNLPSYSAGELEVFYMATQPESANEVVPRSYIDSLVYGVDVSRFDRGYVVRQLIPAFSGQTVKAAGALSVNVNIGAVTQGWTSKATVGPHGYVTAVSSLGQGDIPTLSYNKIISGKPTTLAGAGLTTVVSNTGSTVSGNISIAQAPGSVVYTDPLHAVTKTYVDTMAAANGGSAGYQTGDIRQSAEETAPSGYLRCNGAELLQSSYPALYAQIGTMYNDGEVTGSGQPWRQQNTLNELQSGDITGWTAGTAMPIALYNGQAVVTKNKVYYLGGRSGTSDRNTIYMAPLNSDGSLGTWSLVGNLPVTIRASQAIVTKNRVYLIGGIVNGPYSDLIYTAPIDADGTIGAWTQSGNLPAATLSYHHVVTKNRIYILGGHMGGAYSSTIYTAPIDADGVIGSWSTYPISLPATVYASQLAVVGSRIYLLGGLINAVTGVTCYTTTIKRDGTLGTWTTANSIPTPIRDAQVVVTKNQVYLIGGRNGTPAGNTVYTAPILADNTIGTWSAGTSLTVATHSHQVVVVKNKIHILGGYDSFTQSAVYTATIQGGSNDYSGSYSGAVFSSTPLTHFKLPDYSQNEYKGVYSYIKT